MINFKTPHYFLSIGLASVFVLFASLVPIPIWKGDNGEESREELGTVVVGLMEKYHIPGVSIAFLEEGKLARTATYGVLQKGDPAPISPNTMFSVGSVSKVVNAMGILKLVDQGVLDLDTDVNKYLTAWKVPYGRFGKQQPVTLRHILSHTAGFSVHGFADFLPGQTLPSTVEILLGKRPAKNFRVKLLFEPGSSFKYSGGGTTVTQLIVEEATGKPYAEAIHELLFEPLGLKRSSYQNPLPSEYGEIAKAHNTQGNPVALPRGYQAMPEMAASGLWTCPSDLATLWTAFFASYSGNGAGLFSQSLAQDMASAEPNSTFGLGPKTEQRAGQSLLTHNGSNDSYKAHFTMSLSSSTGFIVMTNGAQGSDFISELRPTLEAELW